jgi:hypothetical protein
VVVNETFGGKLYRTVIFEEGKKRIHDDVQTLQTALKEKMGIDVKDANILKAYLTSEDFKCEGMFMLSES